MNSLWWKSLIRVFLSSCRHDILRKLIALFFGCLVYYSVDVKLAGERRITGVPVKVSIPPELIDMEPKVYYVTVTVSGSRKNLPNVDANELRAVAKVDYNNFESGVPYTIRLTPSMFRTTNNARVSEIDTSNSVITLNLQLRKSKMVKIEAQFDSENKLSRNYEVGDVKFIPSEVQITGPELSLEKIFEVKTIPIPLDAGVTESFEYDATLISPSPLISVSPSTIKVQTQIDKNYVSRIFNSIDVAVLSNLQGENKWKIDFVGTKRVELSVSGLERIVSALSPLKLQPYVDISNIKETGTYELDVKCFPPGDNMQIRSIYPDSLKVKISK